MCALCKKYLQYCYAVLLLLRLMTIAGCSLVKEEVKMSHQPICCGRSRRNLLFLHPSVGFSHDINNYVVCP